MTQVESQQKINFDELFWGWSPIFLENLKRGGTEFLIMEYKNLVDVYYRRFVNSEFSLETHSNLVVQEEYFNDVSCRTALQIIIDSLDSQESLYIRKEIAPYDEILKTLILLNKTNKINPTPSLDELAGTSRWWRKFVPIGVYDD